MPIALAIFVSIILQVGCVDAATTYPWTQDGGNAAHAGASGGPAPVNRVLWTSATGGIVTGLGPVAEGLVFAVVSTGVIALDQQTGALIRSFSASGVRNLAVLGSRLVVAEDSGMVRAFTVATGSQEWATATGPTATLAARQGKVLVNTGISDGRLRALDAATGTVSWTFSAIAGSSSPPSAIGSIVLQNSAGDGRVKR